jgi:hypothetical protein
MLGFLIALSYNGKEEFIDAKDLFSLCLVGGIGLITILSGNFITFSIMWVIWEVILILIRSSDDVSGITSIDLGKKAIQRLICVPLALTVGAILSTDVNGTSPKSQMVITWALLLGVLVVCLRIYLSRNHNIASMDRASTYSGVIWNQGLTIITGFTFLNRIFESWEIRDQIPIVTAIGAILIGAGIVQSFSTVRGTRNLLSPATTLVGIGILIQMFRGETRVGMLELVGSLLLIAYVSLVLPSSTRRWSRVTLVALGSLLIGLPGSISSGILNAILESIENGMGYFLATMCLLGMTTIAASNCRSRLEDMNVSPSGENTIRIREISTPLVVLVAGLLMGLMLQPSISVGSVSLFALVLILSGLVTYASTRLDPKLGQLIPESILDGVNNWMSVAWGEVTSVLTRSIRASGRVFEGRAGLLWVYVIVQFIIVALGVIE